MTQLRPSYENVNQPELREPRQGDEVVTPLKTKQYASAEAKQMHTDGKDLDHGDIGYDTGDQRFLGRGFRYLSSLRDTGKKHNTIADLQGDNPRWHESILNSTPKREVLGYHVESDGGGCVFCWNPDMDKSKHNGGKYIDPDWNNGIFGDAEDDNWHSSDPSNTGSGLWVRPDKPHVNVKEYGAKGDGFQDDYNAIQACLNDEDYVLLPPTGANYLVSKTIKMANRTTLDGLNQNWSNGSPLSSIKYVGVDDLETCVIQCARQPFGTPSTTSLTSAVVKNIHIDGNGKAGTGIYCNYFSNNSRIENVTILGCNLFGLLASKLWYSEFSGITVRHCDGVGAAFGWNYNGTYDDIAINGILIENIRINSCGSQYDAILAPTGFSEADEPKGGCGVYLNVNTNCIVNNINAEQCYAAGVTIEGSGISRLIVNSIYLENNSQRAVTNGDFTNHVGLYLISVKSGMSQINGLYAHESNSYVRVLQKNTSAHFYLNLLQNIFIESDTGVLDNITVENATQINGTGLNQNVYGSSLHIIPRGIRSDYSGGTNRGGAIIQMVDSGEYGFASGQKVNLYDVISKTSTIRRGHSISLLVQVGYNTYSQNTGQAISDLYIVNIATTQRYSTVPTTDSNVQITKIGTQAKINAGNSFLTNTDLKYSVVEISSGLKFTFYVQPTSTGDQADNHVLANAQLMGSGLGSAPIPLITLA